MNTMVKHNVTVIPVRKKYSGAVRAGIYCRVSSTKADQIESLKVQISGLTSQIAYNPGYVLVDTYIDVASGETLEGRPGFQRMIDDCEKGKIQYIFTKSVSRFSRDTIVALEAINKCKKCKVPIYFEAEDLKSDDPMVEVELTAHLAYAQSENFSRKENISWGLHVGAKLGTSKLYNKVCFGYKHDKQGSLIVNDKEAKIVRYIFHLYLDGYSVLGIVKQLRSCRIPSPEGNEIWNKHYIEKLLTNVKYAGDVELLQIAE